MQLADTVSGMTTLLRAFFSSAATDKCESLVRKQEKNECNKRDDVFYGSFIISSRRGERLSKTLTADLTRRPVGNG